MESIKMRSWFKEARENKGLTKTELAEQVKVVKSHIAGIEYGTKNPSGPVALRLSKVLEVSMDKFFEDQL